MNERIRIVRDFFELSRAAFGERIGLSGDVINNLERGRVEIKDYIIKLICTEYGISEEWLRYNKGSMRVESPTFSFDAFAKSRGATDLELEIIKAYFDIEPTMRENLLRHFIERLFKKEKVRI